METGATPVLRWPDHFKPVAGAAIPVRRGHAANEKKFVRVYSFLFRVEQFVAQMKPLHDADDHAIPADLQCAPLDAFQARG